MNRYFYGGLNEPLLTTLRNEEAWTRQWNAILFLSAGHTCTKGKKSPCMWGSGYKESWNLQVDQDVKLTGIMPYAAYTIKF